LLNTTSDEEVDDDDELGDPQEEDSTSIPDVPDPYDGVYSNIPKEEHKLKPVYNCQHCNAKKFESKPPGFSCCSGKIELSTPDTPPDLMRLWSSADADARHFHDNIRFFNGHFSFTSLYCYLDSMTIDIRNSGVYTFRAHGQMYHNIQSFGRQEGTQPKHLELYFYDDDPSLEHRYRSWRKKHYEKDKEVIERLVAILRGNPYSDKLKTMGQIEQIDDYCVTLNLDQKMDQRVYNVPINSEVAAIWIEGSERRGQFQHSVIHY